MARAQASSTRRDHQAGIAALSSGEDLAAGAASPDDRGLAALRQRWRRIIGRAAPPGMGARLMLRILLWREQIGRVGDVDRVTRAKLAAALGETPQPCGKATTVDPRPRVGTVLVREHQGMLHRVTVTSDGFVWRERTFRSLSAVARAITGTSWNGRRFFGVANEGKLGARPNTSGAPAGSTRDPAPRCRSDGPGAVHAASNARTARLATAQAALLTNAGTSPTASPVADHRNGPP